METNRTIVENWLDTSFFQTGAFVTLHESDEVILGKGHGTSKEAFLMKDFFSDQFFEYHPISFLRTSLNLLKEITALWADAKYRVEENTDHLYADDFQKLKSSFNYALKKVVLVSRETYQLEKGNSQKSLFAKSLSFGTGSPYGFWNGNFGIIGCTPEILFTLKGNHLKTFALAGTSSRDKGEELLKSTKDLQEHQFVIDDIQEKINPWMIETNISPTYLAPFKNLVHLRTNIEAKIKTPVVTKELAAALSPTAALGGFPKLEAFSFLKSTSYFKSHPQRRFGSCLGLVTEDVTEFLVMIRNVQWQGSEFFIESGGGVVPESTLQNEIEEIAMKRKVVRDHYL